MSPAKSNKSNSESGRAARKTSLRQQASTDHFRLVADATYDWESWHQTSGQVMWINPAVERITGYTVAECLAMPRYPLPLVYEGDLARISELYAGFQNETSGNDIEFRIRHRDNHVAFVAISWQPMYDRRGRHLGCRTSIRDISERQEMRGQITRYNEHLELLVKEKTEELQQLERRRAQLEKLAALGQLAAGVAHEINNPLAGIRNAFQLIRSDLTPGASSYPLLDLVDREIERLAGMVRNMFQTFRREAEAPKPFELDEVVRQVVQMLHSTAAGRSVRLEQADHGKLQVNLPEGQVKQILYNLGRNAIQACEAGKSVQFSACCQDDRVYLSVADQGSGIDDDSLPFIFEPYFSTKGTLNEPSMGLGLSICRRLVQSLGGQIRVETQAGVGSRFTVELPVSQSVPIVLESSQDADHAAAAAGTPHIL
ncbi:MAG: PAS domain S-box protein [Pirellulaceae bacterium]|nr:PAS domain S-box protein [Pirellulaceae bacterium]